MSQSSVKLCLLKKCSSTILRDEATVGRPRIIRRKPQVNLEPNVNSRGSRPRGIRSSTGQAETAGPQPVTALYFGASTREQRRGGSQNPLGTHQPIRKTVTPEIPDKLYFRIGDVARLCEVPAYVLRFWETEFPQLRPNKGGTGQRLYRKRDVEMALRIKSLLYDQGYTIPGARQVFKNEAKSKEAAATNESAPVPVAEARSAPPGSGPVDSGTVLRNQAQLRALRDEMHSLLAMLSHPVAASDGSGPPPKLKAMRPRLVVESPAAPKPMPQAGPPRLQLAQRDLFGADAQE